MLSIIGGITKWLTDRIEQVQFVRITYINTGNFMVVELRDAAAIIDGEEPDTVTVEHITMTRHQFETMPEFMGP